MHQDGFNSIQIMISKIISRAACLTELASNSKSFSNCPDLHGGAPGLPGDRIWMKPALGKKRSFPLRGKRIWDLFENPACPVNCFLKLERNKTKSFFSC